MKAVTRRKSSKNLATKKIVESIDAENSYLYFNLSNENPAACLERAVENRKKAESIGYHEGVIDSYFAEEISASYTYDVERRNQCNETALELAEKISYRKGIGYAKCGIAWRLYFDCESYEEALQMGTESLRIARELQDEFLEWHALSLISTLLTTLGDIPGGFDLFKEALALAEMSGKPRRILSTIYNCAHADLAPDLYEEHVRRAIQFMDTVTWATYQKTGILNSYATTLCLLNRVDEAHQYIDRELVLLPSLPPRLQAIVHLTIGAYYRAVGKETEAILHIQSALALPINHGYARCANCHLGQIFSKTEPTNALAYFEESLRFSEYSLDWEDANCNHGHLADLYLSLGENQKAAEQYAVYRKITEESKKKEEKLRAEYAGIIQRFDESQKQTKHLAEEVEAKSKSLTEKAMLLAEQTELMANFRDDLRAILRKVEANDPAINEIRRKLRELPEAVNWREFDEQFQSVHPQFQKHLEEKYPDLTRMELKICVLLRLNLKSVDISKLLSLSVRTIESHRHNIRKKLHLEPDRDIAKYLANI